MSKIINTSGVASKFTTSALMGLGATQQDANGRFYIDGSMVNVELSRVIAESIYIEEIFREGQSVTGEYTTTPQVNGAVRVMLETPLPFGSRTLSYGGRQGTNGNAGVINTNAPLMPANDEFMVYLNQVNDQMMLFPDLSKEYIPLDVMTKKISSYSKRVAMDRSASTLAEIIAYAYFRSLNDGENLVDEGDLTQENAYATLINNLNGLLDNGDQVRGAFTFPTEGRTIIGRPSFINGIFNRKSGVIMLGGDMAQEMLKNYDLDVRMRDRNYVGTGYKGYAMNFHYQSAPDYIWTLAEKYLSLPAGALDNVDAIAVSFDATAKATGVDLGVKIVDATNVRGQLAQPLNIWGHEAFRKSYVIGKSTLTNDYLTTTLGLNAEKRIYPIAPTQANAGVDNNKISVPVYDSNGAIVGFKEIASVPTPNGDNIKSGIPQVLSVNASVVSGAVASGTTVTLTTDTAGATIYYTTNGSTPTTSSTAYSEPIAISAETTIKAFAVKSGNVPSNVSTFTYTIAE
jgi:hypothetical protein